MKLLAQSSYWVLNKEITKALGSIEASLVLSILCDMHTMHPENDMIYCRQRYLEQETGLTYHKIGKAMDLLEKKDLIYREREKETLQPKVMYKVLEDNVLKLYRLKNLTSIGEKNGGRINNISYKEKEDKEYRVKEIYKDKDIKLEDIWDKVINE